MGSPGPLAEIGDAPSLMDINQREGSVNDFSEVAGLQRYPLARRSLMMTGLISGFTLATQRVEAQAIHTGSAGLDTGEVQIPVHDGHLPAFFARPASGTQFPVILVFEEIFGVHEYIKDVCRRFAHLGCMAVATEYYARAGDISKATDAKQIMQDFVLKTPDAQYMADADATAAWAGANKGDVSRLGVNGFCRGGRQTWLYAEHNPNLKAAVSWYGQLKTPTSPIQPKTVLETMNQVKCPVLGLYGGKDPSNPLEAIHQAEAEARADHKTVEIVIYPDAPHGFHADYRPSYRQQAAEDGWNHAVAWFRRYRVLPAA